MFPPSLPENFNAQEWKGIFVQALENVLHQVHPSLIAKEDALEYIESLIISLLGTLCACQPHSVQDVTERVNKTFPDPIDKWANRDANTALEKGKKNSNIVLPVDKIHQALVKDVLGYKIEYNASLYIVAVLEYIAADILKLTGNYVRNIKHTEITYQDIKVAICADQVLMDMFSSEEDVSLPLVEEPIGLRTEAQSYEDIVKDFIFEETQYMRDLSQIIKVFRAPFVKHFPTSKDLEIIFSNILDIYEFTANLLSSVEEQMEVAAENETLTVGICFLDMAEEEEFSVYEKYVDDMLSPRGKERLYTLMQRSDLNQTLEDEGHGFKDAVKYVLPKLLLGPIYHCLHYFEVIKGLTNVSQNEDSEFLEQANGLLASLRSVLESKIKNGNLPRTKPWETSLRLQGRTGRQQVVQKMSELQKSIDGWEGKDIWQSCSEFILDGVLMKHAKGKPTERHVFLFDGLIILCKPNIKRSSVTYPTGDFKLKEKFHIRKVEIKDKDDTEELKNWFVIVPRDHPNNSVSLSAKSAEEKSNWMAALISLQTRSMLERRLDSILKEEERDRPLILPPPETYRFAKKDSPENIVMEETGTSPTEIPLIKGGTLLKLIERLTYHMYADPKFVKTFLTTFRSFCTPSQLLDLLIERFNIPDPPENLKVDLNKDADTNQRIKDDLKKFRKEYIKPVQFRVVNVLRHWVDHHYYDFERDQSLLHTLNTFLKNVKGKAMKKMAESILKVIRRRFESVSTERDIIHAKPAPPIEWHHTKDKDQFDLMTLHPIEIARQVTLLEFDLYRAVQPSELVGCTWMKENKSTSSPNLLKMISFTNNFICWLEKCIIETENFEERVSVVNRTMEIMLVFQELNNFNGVLEIVSAINSASVFRLEHTLDKVSYRKQFDDAKDRMAEYIGKVGTVHRITERGDVRVQYEGCSNRWTFHPGALTKVHVFAVNDCVRISDNIHQVKEMQKSHGEWTENMKTTLGRVGRVLKVYADGDLRVAVANQTWTFNPACCSIVPSIEPDNNNTNGGHEQRDHSTTLSDLLEQLMDIRADTTGPERLVREAAQGHADAVKDIVTKHPDKVDQKSSGKSALQVASHQGHKEIVQILLTHNAKLTVQDEDGDTALHYSAFGNQPEVMELLLKKGAQINALNNGGCSTLHVAVNKQHAECVRILLKNKCNVNIQDSYGDTALHDAIGKEKQDIIDGLINYPSIDFTLKNKRGFNVLHHAALKGNNFATEKILQKCRQIVDIKKDDGFSAIHLAALNGHRDVTFSLLTLGQANIEIRNNRQQTPLLLAVSQGHTSIVELLVSSGADLRVEDEDGDTTLHLALMRQSVTSEQENTPMLDSIREHLEKKGLEDITWGILMTCYLAEKGADLYHKNHQGKTPLSIIGDSKTEEVVQEYATGNVTNIPSSEKECIICEDQQASIKFEPCGHVVVCQECCQRVKKIKRCFTCRANIEFKKIGDKELSEPIDNPSTDEDITVCTICMERKKDTAFLCGHMVCHVCGESLRNCHMCRRVITKKIPIYL